MSADADLRKRIEQLLADVGVRRETRWNEVRREMSQMEVRLARFESLARPWMDELVVPRLRTLASLIPNSAPLVCTGGAYSAVLPFRQTEDFPVDARVEARIALDIGAERIRTTFEASIIPILMDYEREGTIEYGLEAPDVVAVGVFLDERIVRFVQDYLRVREPDSPYQKDRFATDPVCGMRLRRAEAAGSLEYRGRLYFFCVPECRDRFAGDPDRYIEVPGLPGMRPVGSMRP